MVRAWLQLLRPANVVTSLADVLAGYGISRAPAGADLAWLLLSTACLYAGGVVLNDVFDHRIDAVERPERPLPSGRVKVPTAALAGGLLVATGILAAFAADSTTGIISIALASAIVLYDAWAKHQAFLGPIAMGTCRALNLLLGMGAAPDVLWRLWPLAGLPLVYIAAVTMVSRGEVRGGRRPVVLGAVALVVGVLGALGLIAFTAASRSWGAAAVALTLAAMLSWRILPAFAGALRTLDPPALRRAVRTGVLSLILLDAVIAAAYADMIYCLCILLTGVAASRLSRLFAVT